MIPGSRLTGVLIVLIFLLMFSRAIVQGQAQGDYTVSIGNASLTVTVRTVFLDNFTLNPNPSYVLALTGQNASQAQTAISSALASLVPGVGVAGLEITSSYAGNATTLAQQYHSPRPQHTPLEQCQTQHNRKTNDTRTRRAH